LFGTESSFDPATDEFKAGELVEALKAWIQRNVLQEAIWKKKLASRQTGQSYVRSPSPRISRECSVCTQISYASRMKATRDTQCKTIGHQA